MQPTVRRWLVIFILQAQTSKYVRTCWDSCVCCCVCFYSAESEWWNPDFTYTCCCAAASRAWQCWYTKICWLQKWAMKTRICSFLSSNIALSWAAVFLFPNHYRLYLMKRKGALPLRSNQMIWIHWHEWEADDRIQIRHVCSPKSTIWVTYCIYCYQRFSYLFSSPVARLWHFLSSPC